MIPKYRQPNKQPYTVQFTFTLPHLFFIGFFLLQVLICNFRNLFMTILSIAVAADVGARPFRARLTGRTFRPRAGVNNPRPATKEKES